MRLRALCARAALVLVGVVCPSLAFAQNPDVPNRQIYVPSTISRDSQNYLKRLAAEKVYEQVSLFPPPDDLESWRKVYSEHEKDRLPRSQAALRKYHVAAARTKLGGVSVSDLRPAGWKDNGKVLIYAHGGAFVRGSDQSTYESSAAMAEATGLRVISIGYTTAPFAKWREIQSQMIAVIEALLGQGYTMRDVAMFGDSAGGGLVASTVLNVRDRGMGMPAAVVLWSPWVDLTDAGDTPHTLAAADPILAYAPSLRNGALAYAGGLKLDDPRISPVYADFAAGFSPALITDGTKCIFLSSSVRLYQKLRASRQPVELDVYEGMWHVFQIFGMPESQTSIQRSASFIKQHLE